MKKTLFLLALLLGAATLCAQEAVTGPYTVTQIAWGVFHIEDANVENPAGKPRPGDGEVNNCSDMYLVVGAQKAVLIDLSNRITWYDGAQGWLRRIVRDRAGKRPLTIAVTHNHGDHVGMLDTFREDPRVRYWLPKADFAGCELFPAERTELFADGASFDLGGGCVLKSLTLPGHTPGSTVFFLEETDLMFSGDAIGSGSGVWLFTPESFDAYVASIDRLIAYIEDAKNGIESDRLVIWGGHHWQRRELEKLDMQYIYDMRTLIRWMAKGLAQSNPNVTGMAFLDTEFRYGTATITWNAAAAGEYAVRCGR